MTMSNENGTRSAEMIEEVADKNYYDHKMPCKRKEMDAGTMKQFECVSQANRAGGKKCASCLEEAHGFSGDHVS